MPGLLWTSYRRYLTKNWWLPLLSVCAIAIGVAVILAIDIASISARRSFELSTQALTGRATHSLLASGALLPDTLYRKLRVEWGLRASAPVVEGDLRFPEIPLEPTLTLLGVDLLADNVVREWTSERPTDGQGDAGIERMRLLGSSNLVVMSGYTARRWGWSVGESRVARIGAREVPVKLAGLLEPSDPSLKAALDNLLIADIATAQNVLAQLGLNRIDLVLDSEQEQDLRSRLQEGLVLQEAGESRQTAEELAEAFHTSLQALSYLCLLVATFLIFNVVSFTLAHRKQSLGRLRVLGVTSQELARLILGEALLLGGAGSLLGVGLGVVLGRELVPMVARSVNDLYYLQSITRFVVEPSMLAKALFWGLSATLLAALVPSFLAARAQPLELLHRVPQPSFAKRRAKQSAILAFPFLALALLLFSYPGLTSGLFALLMVVLGYGALVPGGLLCSVQAGARLSKNLSYRMACRGVSAYFARSATAVVALTVAVAATVSIATMVSSFRGTLMSWLEATLTADIYVAVKARPSLAGSAVLSPESVLQATSLEGVREWTGQHVVVTPSETGETLLVGVKGGQKYIESMRFLESSPNLWARFESGDGVLLTEPYSRRSGKTVGDTLKLSTPGGERAFPVLAVYYSYAPDRNTALLSAQKFEPLFGSDQYTGLAFYLQPGVEAAELVGRLKSFFGDTVEVKATGELRRLALEIFERTFTVTSVLRFLALGIAVVGVLLSLTALAIEREAEAHILRALGFSSEQLLGLTMIQSLWLGLVTGILACPLGLVLAQIMIGVLNRRAFGWTIHFMPDLAAMLSSVILGLLVSLLAGLYPAWRWSRIGSDEALRRRE